MGTCKYCHESAGLLRSTHRECEERAQYAASRIRTFFGDSLNSQIDASTFSHTIRKIAEAARLPSQDLDKIIIQGFSNLVDRALDDHILSADEEHRIAELREAFELSPEQLESEGLQQRLVKAAILRDLEERVPKNRLSIIGDLPFLMQKSEELVWVFQGVSYHTIKDRVQYVGGSSGVSVRVMKGVYLRTGGYKGERITTQSLELQDHGTVGITTKHIYFKGAVKAFRIALTKLVSVERFSDGIGIVRDGANAKLQVFAVDDPWFAANVLARL